METDRVKQDAQAKKFMALAKKYGVEKNFLFTTTFERYLTQLRILDDLQEVIEDEETIVTKEYIKDSKNIYVHPAINEYNRTTDSSNKTANVLMNIVLKMKSEVKAVENDVDKFMNEYGKSEKSKAKGTKS